MPAPDLVSEPVPLIVDAKLLVAPWLPKLASVSDWPVPRVKLELAGEVGGNEVEPACHCHTAVGTANIQTISNQVAVVNAATQSQGAGGVEVTDVLYEQASGVSVL